MGQLFFSVTTEPGRLLLKELQYTASSKQNVGYQEAMLNSVLLCVELLSKISQVLSGFSWPHWHDPKSQLNFVYRDIKWIKSQIYAFLHCWEI